MGLIKKDRFILGDYNSVSDYSGQKYKRSDMKLTWDNFLVGKEEWDPKQPQLTIRPRTDRSAITMQTRTQGEDPGLLDPTFDPASGSS